MWGRGRGEKRGPEQRVIQPIEIRYFISSVHASFIPGPLNSASTLSIGFLFSSQMNVLPIHWLSLGKKKKITAIEHIFMVALNMLN